MDVAQICQGVTTRETMLQALALDLFERPEPAFEEYYASQRVAEILCKEEFAVEYPAAGLPTAIIARWGEGHPVIGLLAEYDALPGFSQKVADEECPVTPGGAGHGCGHNLMAAAHLGAALAVRDALQAKKCPGTIVFFGCPAEEVLTGKVFMAREGAFAGLDCALNFHPNATNGLHMRGLSGVDNIKFTFHGTSAHASTAPFDGRSASDAVELMNVGANYLREHIPLDVRMHYVTTEGGKAPNIVPNRAQNWYFIRAPRRETIDEVRERLVLVAKGAAMMTQTEVQVEYQGGCYPTIQNRVLADLICETLLAVGVPEYTQEELDFAAALARRRNHEAQGAALCDRVMPLGLETDFAYNSSDIGDVSYLVPTVMFNTACFPLGANLHSWYVAACAGHSIGQKGMLYAAKTLACAAMQLFEHPEIIQKAHTEWQETTANQPYRCPIPAGVLPPIAPNK